MSNNMSEFKSKEIGLRMQKKLASKMSKKSVAKMFIDESTSQFLDDFYGFVKFEKAQNRELMKETPEKLIKNVIKIVVKVGILDRNEAFSEAEYNQIANLKGHFNTLLLTVISCREIDFSYDQKFLMRRLNSLRDQITSLLSPHLTNKSIGRVDMIFDFLTNGAVLDDLFVATNGEEPKLTELRKRFFDHISKLRQQFV